MTDTSDKDRGIHYADGGTEWGALCYPDPDRVAAINQWWTDNCDPATGVITASQLRAYFDKCAADSQRPPWEFVVPVHPKLYEQIRK